MRIMRKLIIASVVVLTGLVVVGALNVNFLIERNKGYLLAQLGQTFGHDIAADKVEMSYIPFAFRVVNLAVAGTSGDALLTAKDAQISVRLLPLLLGRLLPERISLDAPVVTIQRAADGSYNYERQNEKKQRNQDGSRRKDKDAGTAQEWAVPALQVSKGTVRYRDLKYDGDITVAQIELSISDIGVEKAIDIDLAAAVTSDKVNLKLTSRIGPIAGIGDFRNYPIDGTLDAQQLDLGKINRALPQLRRATPRHLRFDGIYDIEDLKFTGALNNLSLKGALKGTDASFRLE